MTRPVQIPVPTWAAQNTPQQPIPASAYVSRVNAFENSTGNPAAPNASGPGGTPTSSAVGDGQFTQGTWLPLFRSTFPGATNVSDQQALAMRANPQVSALMTQAYARQNAGTLSDAGLPVNSATLGMAHYLGPQGAVDVMQAPPGTLMSAVLPPSVIQANPAFKGQTVDSFRQGMTARYGTSPVNLGPGVSTGPAPAAPSYVGKPEFTPQQEAADKELGVQQTAIQANAGTAGNMLRDLDVLSNATQSFRTGATGPERADAMKTLVDGFQFLGITPPASWVNGTASAETIEKTGMDLAIQRTKQLGSREAGMVLLNIQKNLPNTALSQDGFSTVVNALRQSAQHDEDLDNFRQNWVAAKGSWAGGQATFDKEYPPEAYASRVVPMALPPRGTTGIANVIYNTAHGPALWTGSGWRPLPAGGASQ